MNQGVHTTFSDAGSQVGLCLPEVVVQECVLSCAMSPCFRSASPCPTVRYLQSTLFNALVVNGKALAANYPFATIEPNSGIVAVPDARLQVLSDISGSKELVSGAPKTLNHGGTTESLRGHQDIHSLLIGVRHHPNNRHTHVCVCPAQLHTAPPHTSRLPYST